MTSVKTIAAVVDVHRRTVEARHQESAYTVERVSSVVGARRSAAVGHSAAVVRSVAAVARATLSERERSLRASLENRVASYAEVGAVPSLFKVMGTSDRELPYNRTLAWVLDPGYAHGAGLPALRALARSLDFPELQADLDDHSSFVEVRGERVWPPDAESSKEPDLLVLTTNAILLIENKLTAPESGDQYLPYLAALKRLAEAREAAWQAWLVAPTKRDVPKGWTGSMDHRSLAECLATAASDSSNTAWGRVACLLVAEEILRDRDRGESLRRAHDLLGKPPDAQGGRVREIATLLRRLPFPISPVLAGDQS